MRASDNFKLSLKVSSEISILNSFLTISCKLKANAQQNETNRGKIGANWELILMVNGSPQQNCSPIQIHLIASEGKLSVLWLEMLSLIALKRFIHDFLWIFREVASYFKTEFCQSFPVKKQFSLTYSGISNNFVKFLIFLFVYL